MLSPQSLLTHGGSTYRGQDIAHNIVQTLQRYDTTFTELLARVDRVFGSGGEGSGGRQSFVQEQIRWSSLLAFH